MKLRPITKSSAELTFEAPGNDSVRVLFSFDFPAAIEARGRVAVLARGERKLKSTSQHIKTWIDLRLAEGLPALSESGPAELSAPSLESALRTLLSPFFYVPNP